MARAHFDAILCLALLSGAAPAAVVLAQGDSGSSWPEPNTYKQDRSGKHRTVKEGWSDSETRAQDKYLPNVLSETGVSQSKLVPTISSEGGEPLTFPQQLDYWRAYFEKQYGRPMTQEEYAKFKETMISWGGDNIVRTVPDMGPIGPIVFGGGPPTPPTLGGPPDQQPPVTAQRYSEGQPQPQPQLPIPTQTQPTPQGEQGPIMRFADTAQPEQVRAFEDWRRREPNDPIPAGFLAAQESSAGRPSQSESLATEALSRGMRDPDLYYIRGKDRMQLGRNREAVEDLRDALRLNPGHRQAQELLKLAENKVSPTQIKGPSTQELTALTGGRDGEPSAVRLGMGRKAAEAAPGSPRVERLMQEAQGRIKVGDYDGALKVLKSAVEAAPQDVQAAYLNADTLVRAGKDKEAEEEAGRILGMVPDNAGALNMRAMARNRRGDYAAALKDSDAALRAKPDSALAYFNRGYALAGLQRRAEALESAGRAAALDHRFQDVLDRLRGLPQDADPLLAFTQAGRAGASPVRGTPDQKSPDHTARAMAAAGLVAALVGLGAGFWRRGAPRPAAQPESEAAEASAAAALPAVMARKREPEPVRRSGSETLAPGSVLGEGYRVEAELGRGSMGVVFKAIDLTLKRPVAVKMLRSYARGRPESVEGLLQEARLVAGLKHPNIVQIHSAVVEGDDILLVFEYVAGRPLSAVLTDFHHLPLEDIKVIVRQVAEALDYAHAQRVIHRDLKPANIMIGGDGKASVMDFGLAHQVKAAASNLTNVGSWGSPAYMAPEQELGSVCASSDIYALGACLYEMLTGEPPFPGASGLAQKQGMLFAPPSGRVPDLPREVDDLTRRALAAEPQARFPTARDLAAAVEALPEPS